MKLLFCKECHDVKALTKRKRTCRCGKSSGKYVTYIWAEYNGPCVILGMMNSDIQDLQEGDRFDLLVMPEGWHIHRGKINLGLIPSMEADYLMNRIGIED